MIKRVTVNFDFDPETETVSDLTCFVDGVEKKKTTTRATTKKDKEIILEPEALITLEPTKLVLNNKCVADMKIVYQDRLVIKYQRVGDAKKPIPLIGKDVDWAEEGTGNKITKTNTLAYRGKANTILAEFGTEFGLEEYKEGIWKLVPKNEGIVAKKAAPKTYEDVEQQAEDVDITIFTDDDDMTEIGEMPFTL